MTRLRLVVTGRVQGVGYRWFACERAESLLLSGWVKNLPDGAVELEAEGSDEALERFVSELKTGPAAARVSGIKIEQAAPKGGPRAFNIRSF